jgi:16S rRNA (guanine527-N7)-methyltransferase
VTSREFQDRLASRALHAGVTVSPDLARGLETYFRLLAGWNARINLTALPLNDPPPETFDRLLIEPLAAAQHVPPGASRMLDVGSGGGSPAIPLALAVPGLRLLMVEARSRKSVFLREAIRALGLPGAEVANVRVEELAANTKLHESQDLVTVRAVRIDSPLLRTVQVFLRTGGQLFLFSGAEMLREAIQPQFHQVADHQLLDSASAHLAVWEKR